MKYDYETYFQLTQEQKRLLQNLLLHEYMILDIEYREMVRRMKQDWKMYERAERYDTCQLFKDTLKSLDER